MSNARLKKFLDEFNSVCERHKKDPKTITVLGASKNQDIRSMKWALDLGISNFGENRLQESEAKIDTLGNTVCWHFIGSIQSKKAKKISSQFDWVQTVDRIKIAKILNENRPESMNRLNICIQVNPDGEKTKSGVSLEGCEDLIEEMLPYKRLKIRGIMSIPKPCGSFKLQREGFARIHSCFKQLKQKYPQLDTLSTGMSGDYEAAIIEGSNMIRIGTRLFGERS